MHSTKVQIRKSCAHSVEAILGISRFDLFLTLAICHAVPPLSLMLSGELQHLVSLWSSRKHLISHRVNVKLECNHGLPGRIGTDPGVNPGAAVVVKHQERKRVHANSLGLNLVHLY